MDTSGVEGGGGHVRGQVRLVRHPRGRRARRAEPGQAASAPARPRPRPGPGGPTSPQPSERPPGARALFVVAGSGRAGKYGRPSPCRRRRRRRRPRPARGPALAAQAGAQGPAAPGPPRASPPAPQPWRAAEPPARPPAPRPGSGSRRSAPLRSGSPQARRGRAASPGYPQRPEEGVRALVTGV